MVRNLPAVQETQVRSLGQQDPLEKEMVTHFSILAWRIPWTEESDITERLSRQTCICMFVSFTQLRWLRQYGRTGLGSNPLGHILILRHRLSCITSWSLCFVTWQKMRIILVSQGWMRNMYVLTCYLYYMIKKQECLHLIFRLIFILVIGT